MQSRRKRQVWGACGQPVCDRKIKTRTLSRPQGGRRLAPQTGRLRPGHSPCVTSVINNGMTRATRCCMINSEQAIPIEVIEIRSEWDLGRLPAVAETMTPDF